MTCSHEVVVRDRTGMPSSAHGRARMKRTRRRARKDTLPELAHELRKWLATIMLWEQILRRSDDPALRQQGLDAIRDCARAQDRVIEHMLRLRAPATRRHSR